MFFKGRYKNNTMDKGETPSDFHKLENLEEGQYNPLVKTFSRSNDQILRGPKLRFTEDAYYNLDIVKNLVTTPNLVAEVISLGTSGPKEVIIVYIDNIANTGIVKEIKDRLRKIKARSIYESIYIQRNIEDSSLSPFPQIKATERPDVAMSALWQGRVTIILEEAPMSF